MIGLDLRSDARLVRSVLAGYQRGADIVLQRTLNRVMDPSVKTAASREISRELGIPRAAATRSLNLRRANIKSLSTDLGAALQRIPLINFNAKQTPKGVTYKIGKNPRALLPSGFINPVLQSARGRSFGVFNMAVLKRARADSGEGLVPRDPVWIKYGPSPAAVFVRDTVLKLLGTTARERWTREIAAQIKFFLSQQPG